MLVSKWFLQPKPRPKAKVNLICFPYAGGSASTYLPWINYLPETVNLIAVQPPGRSSRMFEQAYSEMDPLIDSLINDFSKLVDRPYFFFGHSLGCRVAYELALRCQKLGIRLPEHIIVSGSRAAYLPCNEDPLYDLPDSEFIAKLETLNGTPKEILENKELMELCLPLLRADFKLADTYCANKQIVHCPVTVFGGSEDYDITFSDLQKWEDLFTDTADVHLIPGDHFFIESNRQAVLNQVNNVIKKVLSELIPGRKPLINSV